MGKMVAVAALALLVAWSVAPEAASAQEMAWSRGAPLNLRRGPGTEFKIIGSVKPGDRIQIKTRGNGWTEVLTGDGRQGWIAAGFLDAVAPPAKRLTQLESETDQLKQDLDLATREVDRLRSSYEEISSRDGEQRTKLDRLTEDNAKLRAGSAWADRIAGALILCTGMVLGAIWHRLATRSRGTRLRL